MGLPINRPLQSVRHLARYREIVSVLAKHGFGDIISRIGLNDLLPLPTNRRRKGDESAPPIRTPQRARMLLEELGPTFVKLGQILSIRPDLIPPEYINELVKLQDEVPGHPWEQIKDRIEYELGQPLEEIFTWVDPEPLGAASLAQVHAAELPDGSQVVIKVQRPRIEHTIEVDLEILHNLALLVENNTPLGELADLTGLAEEFAATINEELDYRRESSYAERFRRNFADEEKLYIPTIYWDYVTRRVMVMERLQGIKIDNVPALIEAGYDPVELSLVAAQIIVKEVMQDGFFHADVHPGNYLVMEGGIIGAMDFGMIGWLDPQERLEFVRLYIALVQADAEGVTDGLIRMSTSDFIAERAQLRRDVARLVRKYQGLTLKNIQIPELLGEVTMLMYKHRLRLPGDFWLLIKTLAMMESLGLKLNPDFDVFAVSEPYVRQLQFELWNPDTWGPILLKTLGNWSDFIIRFPAAGDRIVRRVEQGDLQVPVEISDLDQALKRLDGIADRITLGIVLASMIVGLALLIPHIGGNLLQIILIVAFVGVSAVGFWLLVSIIRNRG